MIRTDALRAAPWLPFLVAGLMIIAILTAFTAWGRPHAPASIGPNGSDITGETADTAFG